MLKKKEQALHTPILSGIVLHSDKRFFSRNQMERRQENVEFQLGLVILRGLFEKLLMYEPWALPVQQRCVNEVQ